MWTACAYVLLQAIEAEADHADEQHSREVAELQQQREALEKQITEWKVQFFDQKYERWERLARLRTPAWGQHGAARCGAGATMWERCSWPSCPYSCGCCKEGACTCRSGGAASARASPARVRTTADPALPCPDVPYRALPCPAQGARA